MGRQPKAAAEATRRLAATPNFSAFGIGTAWQSLMSLLPELRGVDLLRDMFIMADTDETVGAMLFAINSTMRQVEWEYVPQIDGIDAPDDAEAQRYAALAQTMLKDMDQAFDDHVEDALTMIWAGFAPIEIVLKRRDGVNSRHTDGFYGIDSLNLLDQTTVWDWVYENGKPVAMRQMGAQLPTGSTGIIPLSKTLLYRTSTAYNNPRGRPLLKNAWRVWKLKRKIQDSEAIGIERELCGLPIFEMPEEIINQQFELETDGTTFTKEAQQARAMVTAAQSAVKDMRLNKSGGLVIPSNSYAEDIQGDTNRKYNFRIMTSAGQRTIDSRTAARDYDHAIARVAMMQFLTLGQRSGGSYGLSEDQSSMAVSSMMALADKVTAEWNLKLVPLVWRVNVFPDKYRPRLKHSDINKNSIVQLGQFLSGVAKAANLWGGDAKMRRAIATAGNLPYDAAAQDAAAKTAQKTAEAGAVPKPAPGEGSNIPGGREGSEEEEE